MVLYWPTLRLRLSRPHAETFALPAENATVAEPEMQGVAVSGPSFKMARGATRDTNRGGASRFQNEEIKRKADAVERFKEKLYSDDDEAIMEAATYFRERLSVANAPVGEIRVLGVVPRLIELLSRESNPQIMHEAAWAITNICSAHHDDCQDVVDQGAVPTLARLLRTSKVREGRGHTPSSAANSWFTPRFSLYCSFFSK